TPHQPVLDRIVDGEKRAGEILASDPIGAKTILDAALADSKALLERADALIARLEEGEGAREALRKLRDDVAKHRAGGLRLDEEMGNPDPLVALADEALGQARAALED